MYLYNPTDSHLMEIDHDDHYKSDHLHDDDVLLPINLNFHFAKFQPYCQMKLKLKFHLKVTMLIFLQFFYVLKGLILLD